MASKNLKNAGRKLSSLVWTGNFFEKRNDGLTYCLAKLPDGSECDFQKPEKYPSNLEYHLATSHKEDGSGAWQRYKKLVHEKKITEISEQKKQDEESLSTSPK